MWVPRTDAKDSGYWLTPRASDTGKGEKNETFIKRMGDRSDNCAQSLAAQVNNPKTWPTSRVKMCKTPSAADAYTGNMKKDEFKFGNSGSLAQEVERGFLETHRNWPTPSVSDTEGGQQSDRVEQTRSGAYILRKKNKPDSTFGAKLSDAVLFEEKNMWPTPAARDYKGHNSVESMKKKLAEGKRAQQGQLPNAVAMTGETGGQLNPTWVEWLMGWPLGWTDLKRLETDKYQQWLQLHGCC